MRLTHFLALVFLMFAIVPPATSQQSPSSNPPQRLEPALQKLANAYFAAYAHKDATSIKALWSSRSPERDSNAKHLHEWFVSASSLLVSEQSVDLVEFAAARATLRLSMRIKASNEPAPEPRRAIHTLVCVREEANWKISSDTEQFESLADSLTNAKDSDRPAILHNNEDRTAPELVVALVAAIRSLEAKGKFDQALSAATLAKQIAESIHDKVGLGLVLLEFGFIQQIQGKYDDALNSYQQVTAIAEDSHNPWLSATAIGSTGLVFRRLGNLQKSLEYVTRCLPMFEALGDKEKTSYRLSDLGMIYLRLGDYPSAQKYLEQSLTLFEERDDRSGVAFVSQNLGTLSAMRNDNVRSLQYYEKALEIDEEMGNRHSISLELGNIGGVYEIQNDYAQSMDYYRRSLALTREMHDKPGEGTTLANIGGIYQRTREWDAALSAFREAQSIFQQADVKDGEADCLLSIGIVLQRRHQFAAAREQYVKALSLNQETSEQERIGESLDNLANVDNDLGQPTRALESSTRACEIAHQMNDRANIVSCRTSMGESYSQLHQPVQAREAFEEAITALESMRKDVVGGAQQQQAFLDPSSSTPYHDMVKLLLEEKQLPDAFSYIEREKARALLDVIRSGHESLDKVLTDADRDTQQQLRLQLASFNSQMEVESDDAKLKLVESQRDALRLKLEDFETGLYARYPELSVHRGQAPIITLSQASELPFDDKTALLEFMVSDDETMLLVFTREGRDSQWSISAYPIKVDKEALGEQTRAFRSQMAARQLGFQASARHLYNLLVRPAAEQFKGKTALIVVPDGTLWNLPFQSLLDPSGHYLLETFAIAYAPSLTVMREMMRKRSESPQEQSPRFLAMANPILAKQTDDRGAHRGNPFNPLPHAEDEAKALAQLYGAGNSRVYTGEQATVSRFKAEASGFGVVHLATHGFTSDSSPMYSSVLLSPGGQQDDGLLEAREIMNLDLHAKLVVLSACETARGRVGEGEGMIGLTWAFFAAGVPSIVASQWKVDSESTTKLMLAFHRDLRQQRGTALATARSLREAALKLLHDPQYAHPFYWSAFVVVGDPN